MIRIACQQLDPVIGDLAGNRALALAAIREAVESGADVVVLPELVTSGYMFDSPEEAAAVAIAPGHEILAEWAEEAARADIVLAAGFCELGDDGRVFNSAAVIDAGGLRAVYRKLHLWDREELFFTPGSAPPPVLDTRVGRVAAVICYDLEFPELTRSVALAGTQLLLVPTNWPLVPRPEGERPPEALIGMAAARVNRMAVACADRVGRERGQEWTGGTTIIGVDGWVAAESRAPGLVSADVDLAPALSKRLTENADAFADRRPELYTAVTRQSEPSGERLRPVAGEAGSV
ncbi:MAG TPA: nitrilase-related carbon-nitrogen hydrolase [Solirubrobacteraceae bacterium]|nr:nitrilase-related carbon-nitrogen hydrolase [Solirubrobacteraceae bacterium]